MLGTTSYDAFGSVRSQTGQQGILGFTGQQTEPTGLSFLRARYYNSSLGRFISPDSVQPNALWTQGYNLYSYVANNPTTFTDPSGRLAIEYRPGLLASVGALVLRGVAWLIAHRLQVLLVALLATGTVAAAATLDRVIEDSTPRPVPAEPSPQPTTSRGLCRASQVYLHAVIRIPAPAQARLSITTTPMTPVWPELLSRA